MSIQSKGHISLLMKKMIRNAIRNNDDWIDGKALGPTPKFFVVGEEPNLKDYLVKQPFSGKGQMLLTHLVSSLDERYKGVTMEDMYITYMVKTTFQRGQLTEQMVEEEWLPIVQMEFYLSGCTDIVPMGNLARIFAGHIGRTPEVIAQYEPNLWQRIQNAYKALVD